VSGESIASDVIVCQLKAIQLVGYKVANPEDLGTPASDSLPAIFPTGVCELLEAWRRAATAAWQLVGLRH
jgi:hypothetical protein